MANEVKYNDVNLENGERLATNGYYTGEHKGTTLQDGKYADANAPHSVENATVRLGTMTQDAIDEKFPTVKGE